MVRSLDEWQRGEATALRGWVKPQLTRLVEEPPDGPEWLHEIKFDGYRMHARLDRGAARLLTRTASTGRINIQGSPRRYRCYRPAKPISTGSCAGCDRTERLLSA